MPFLLLLLRVPFVKENMCFRKGQSAEWAELKPFKGMELFLRAS